VRLVGPRGPLISNDAVAAIIGRYPDRFAGVAVRDQRDRVVRRPDDCGHEQGLSGGDGVLGPIS
jgi:predicted TIM-barrel fold metal-dependent hydrolase